jgi:hypothetical protein
LISNLDIFLTVPGRLINTFAYRKASSRFRSTHNEKCVLPLTGASPGRRKIATNAPPTAIRPTQS